MPSIGKTLGKIRNRDKKSETSPANSASQNQTSKIYLKAMPLRNLTDLETVKKEVESGNIIILKVTPLANKNIEEIKKAVNELCQFIKTIDGDIARLGEERIVITPQSVRIWREKTTESQEQLPTAA